MRVRDLAVRIVLSVAMCVALYAAFVTGLSRAVSFEIVFRRIYIPLLGWSCVLLYCALWAQLFGKRLSETCARGLLLGSTVHFLALLVKLNLQLASGSPLSGVYFRYIQMVTVGAFASSFVWVSYLAHRSVRGDIRDTLFFLPLPLLFVLLSFRLAIAAPPVFVTATALGAAVFILSLFADVWSIARRIWRFFMTHEYAMLAAIFAIAAVLRILFAFQILRLTGGGATFIDASDDGRAYDFYGWAIGKELWRIFDPKVIPSPFDPGYSLFLAAIYRFFGHAFYVVTAIQSLINACTPVVVYYLGKIIVRKEVGIIAALFVAFDQASIMHSVVLGTEALSTPLLAFAVLCVVRYFKNLSARRYWYLAGVLFGVLTITRYMLILAPFFVFLVFLCVAGRPFRKKVGDMLVMAGVIALCIAPITLINYLNTGRFHLVEDAGERIDVVWYNQYLGREDLSPSNLRLVAIGFDPFRKPVDSLFLIFRKPVTLVATCGELWGKRLRNFFFWPNFGFSDPILLVNPSRFPNEFGSTIEFYILLAYLVGFVDIFRRVRTDRTAIILFAVFGVFIFIHVIVFMFSTVRYRVPAIPYQAIFLSAGLSVLGRYMRTGYVGTDLRRGDAI